MMPKNFHRDIEEIIAALGADAHKLDGKTILISGSAGFLGNYFLSIFRHLNRAILTRPCSVIALDNLSTGQSSQTAPHCDTHIAFRKQDICQPFLVDGPVDYIIHLAGIASPVFYMKLPLETIRVAVHGTENLLELGRVKHVQKFLFFSSSEIYGDPASDCVPTPETYKGNVSSVGPRACYDESKRLGETLCTTYHQLFGLPVQIVRPFNIYGPGMRPDDGRVIPQFMTCLLNGKPMPVHGNGLQTRSYCYVVDAMIGFFKALLSADRGEIYNIGDGRREINLIDLAHAIAALTGGRAEIAKIPYPSAYPSDEPIRRCPDTAKAARELNFSPRIDLEEGLRRTFEWFKTQTL